MGIHDLLGNIHDGVEKIKEIQFGVYEGRGFGTGFQLIDPLF